MRINKFLTESGFCSRRQADKLITEKQVKINNNVASLGDQVGEGDQVFVNGKLVENKNKRIYIMYNKPRGIVCTTDTNEKDNIIDAIKFRQRIFPIGRLDKDSTGLIFLTNDGNIVNKILRAENGHEKEYWVNVDKPFDEDFLKIMSQGVDIGGYITKPCKLKRVNKSTFLITLTEGKNRQIRRMCESLNYKVRHLKRLRIMNVLLGDLKEGRWKEIEPKDLKKIFELVN
ncbi:MAG: pseudouridine synthase [Oligoflexia bacterium]|nr:pseudouridine synthase [Oligoflexia bacterium]